jgi:outer membrane protein insertion porin family
VTQPGTQVGLEWTVQRSGTACGGGVAPRSPLALPDSSGTLSYHDPSIRQNRSFMTNRAGSTSTAGFGRRLGAVLIALLGGLAACAPEPPQTGPFPRFAEFQGQEVARVTFSGDIVFPRDSLAVVVRTRPSRCSFLLLPICLPFRGIGREEYRLDLRVLAQDISRIQLYHRDHGYYNAQVAPNVQSAGPDRVAVDFVMDPGRQVILRELTVQGVEGIVEEADLVRALPLRVGQPFGRQAFLSSADSIRADLLRRGHAYAEVLRNYGVDTIAGVAEAEFVALAGPVVVVDTVLIEGNERISDRAVRRQLAFREGDVLRMADLNRSQRNLYGVDMVSFATVQIAPDTLQVDVQQEQATVIVQIVEAAQYAVEASAGFGTVDCFRTGGRWVDRNFLGGGRRLEVSGSLSRIGVGAPLDLGLERSVCSALGEEGFLGLAGFDVQDRLDYRAVASFTQPSIFGTQNQLGLNLHSERISEAEAYVRESTGGRITGVRELDAGPTILTTTLEVERGRTLANPAVLCVGFDTCTQEDLEFLRQSRWSNSLSVAALRDGQWTDGITSRGYVLRGGLDWASPALGSDDNYLRGVVEATGYQPLQPGWVLAANLRLGRFLLGILGPEEGYIPPERRFYAGGPNSVRGFARNALGPTSYVALPVLADPGTPDAEPVPVDERPIVGSASGGTQMVVASTEIRFPSPWMGGLVRMAAFVDAGHVSAPGAPLIDFDGIRFTPGVGVRVLTPVGPFRLDLAYNPYDPQVGPLYTVDPVQGLVLRDPNYQPAPPSFLGRFRLQFALGQAF